MPRYSIVCVVKLLGNLWNVCMIYFSVTYTISINNTININIPFKCPFTDINEKHL